MSENESWGASIIKKKAKKEEYGSARDLAWYLMDNGDRLKGLSAMQCVERYLKEVYKV